MNQKPICRILAITFLCLIASSISNGQDLGNPKLMVCGGGALPDQVFQEFRSMAGKRPKLVVIPTASSRKVDQNAIAKLWKSRGFEQVSILHTNDPKTAPDREFIKPLKDATAVWFGGGSQQRIADAYLNTLVEEELHNLLERGGVIGGTSAGGAIQSKVMIASGKTEPKISHGFDFVKGGIIDQHFLKRNRIPRLISAVRQHPKLTGLGIAEGTALLIRDGKQKVIGRSFVLQIKSNEGKISVEAFGNGDFLPTDAR